MISFSPPYANVFDEKRHTGTGITDYAPEKGLGNTIGGYGQGNRNIGNLKYGGFL